MSKYYKINGLKVRVSDHEPNYSLDWMRGKNDVELYTKSICNTKLSVITQIEKYCDDNDLDYSIFKEVMEDYPDPEPISYKYRHVTEKIEVTQEVVDGYLSIKGRGSMRKRDRYCDNLGICSYKMSQGYYTII